jgi:hypothetical protein
MGVPGHGDRVTGTAGLGGLGGRAATAWENRKKNQERGREVAAKGEKKCGAGCKPY